MYKNLSLIIIFFILSQCSLDTKTGLWTKKENLLENKDNLEEIFRSEEILKKEFNPSLKIKLKTSYSQNSFVNNQTNNLGYINFESDLNEISKFKFKKIKNFEFINPDLLLGEDNSILFFDENGTILKFNQNSKLI